MCTNFLIICIYLAFRATSIATLQIVKDGKVGGNSRFHFLGPNTRSSHNKQYWIYDAPLTYDLAEADCKEVGQLAQFETPEEKELVEYYLIFFPNVTDIGLGGGCGENQTRYEWDDSTQILTSVWGENNPNLIEPCQENYKVGGKRVGVKFQLYGFPLNEPRYYICEGNLD